MRFHCSLTAKCCYGHGFLFCIFTLRCRYRSLEIDRERISASESCCDTAEEVLALCSVFELGCSCCVAKVMAVLRQVFGDIAAASAYEFRPAAGLLFRSTSHACVLQLQRAAPAAGRQAHAEALKSQAAEGAPIAPSSQTSRHISTRISCSELNPSRSCPFVSCSLQILDPGAAARGKIKKHLKQQVRTPAALAASFHMR